MIMNSAFRRALAAFSAGVSFRFDLAISGRAAKVNSVYEITAKKIAHASVGYFFAWSVESVGELRLEKSSKCMI